MKKQFYRLGILLLLSSLCACFEEHYMKFDTDFTGIYFTTDSTSYSFSVTPVEVREHTVKIPVQIMGAPSDVDREIKFELVESLSEATEGVHYVLDEAIIPSDTIAGYISVRILRDNLKGDHKNGYDRHRIHLRLLPNEHFTPTLDSINQIHLLKFDNAIEQPEWLNSAGEKVWLKGSLGVWHPYKLIMLVQFFHELGEKQPLTYKKIAKDFGENLENIPEGNPMKYETIFKRHIYKPMYEHFNDPANKEMIDTLYPDFPYDFPNPYPNE